MNGVDLFTIARQVGHKDLKMMERVYGHLLLGHRQEGANAIDGLFTPPKSGHRIGHLDIIKRDK